MNRTFGVLLSALALVTGPAASADEEAAAAPSCQGVASYASPTLSSVVVANFVSSPMFATSPPGDASRLFMVEQGGRVQLHKRGQAPGAHTTFLDITSKVYRVGEGGFLGLAFDPAYATTLHFWVNYTELVGTQIYTVVARYTTSSTNPDVADPTSELRVVRFAQPEENHKGGMLAFGKDGFLYVFTGDGGGGGDAHGPCGNGQNQSTLLGKILRLDVRGIDAGAHAPDCGLGTGVYGIPATNPLSDGPGGVCDEIWSYGLRNPWRSTFDAANGDLYVADVGQACWEEIDWAPASSAGGQNYGWRQMEGNHCYNAAAPGCDPPGAICAGSPPCNDPSITDPILEVSHDEGACAILGGYVYRGCRLPDWNGRYFYGDYCEGFVRTFRLVGGAPADPVDVTSQVVPPGALAGLFSSFGEDAQGEIFLLSLDGQVRKVVPPFTSLEVAAPGTGSPFRLSKTGDWTWEDLYLATEVPVSFYRVYRGAVNGSYSCVLKTASPVWPAGGDPVSPPPGGLFAYVVTAVDAGGQETQRGTTGTFNAATCP